MYLLLGLYLSNHPLNLFEKNNNNLVTKKTDNFIFFKISNFKSNEKSSNSPFHKLFLLNINVDLSLIV